MRDSGNTFRSQEFARQSQQDSAKWQNVAGQAVAQGAVGAADGFLKQRQVGIETEFRQRALEAEIGQQQFQQQLAQQRLAIDEAQAASAIQVDELRRQKIAQELQVAQVLMDLDGRNTLTAIEKQKLISMELENERIRQQLNQSRIPDIGRMSSVFMARAAGMEFDKNGMPVKSEKEIPEAERAEALRMLQAIDPRRDPRLLDARVDETEARAARTREQAEEAAFINSKMKGGAGGTEQPKAGLTPPQQRHLQSVTTSLMNSLGSVPPEIRNVLAIRGSASFARMVAKRQAEATAAGLTESVEKSAERVARDLATKDPSLVFAALASSTGMMDPEVQALLQQFQGARKK